MIVIRKVQIDRRLGRYWDDGIEEWITPSIHDYESFVNDHATERWFMARVISDWERMLPPTCVDPETGYDQFDMEAFIEKFGPRTVAEMFAEGTIDWADETSPVDGKPYLELRLVPSVRA